ncbi:BcsR/BcsP family cellulose biosynthesis protein [Cupriavidus sp. RAF12]|uniref:BcsR/BcsP family cellulose biosynthesis protein n=1 Tax=Cupriavidus sp. RAF12 TaxID=3233050 RepID=UPI003F8F4F95
MIRPPTPRRIAVAYSDIDVLAQRVEGFDAQRYFDQQDDVEAAAAAKRWPLLARVMGCPAADGDREGDRDADIPGD